MVTRRSVLDDDVEITRQRILRRKRGMSTSRQLSYREVAGMKEAYVQDLFSSQQCLVDILDDSQDELIARWTKKTPAKRRKLLRSVYPQLPASHRSDIQEVGDYNAFMCSAELIELNKFLVPALNLEDLASNDKHLITFMKSRARNPPCAFARSDMEAAHLAFNLHVREIDFLPNYTMLLQNQETQSNYGHLLSFKDGPEAVQKLKCGLGVQPGEGLLTLDIQCTIMEFLYDCAYKIMEDARPSEDGPIDSAHTDQAIKPPPMTKWPSLSRNMEEAQYSVPKKFDMKKLLSLIQAKRTQVVENLRGLREDPRYFQQVVHDWSNHRHERIQDCRGVDNPRLGKAEFWNSLLVHIISDAYESVILWEGLLNEVKRLENTLDAGNAGNESHHTLSTTAMHFLARIDEWTNLQGQGPLNLFNIGSTSAPKFRTDYEVEWTNDSYRMKRKAEAKDDRLYHLTNILTVPKHSMHFELLDLCDEIDREIRRDEKNHNRITPWLASQLSNASILAEIRSQLSLIVPRGVHLTIEEKEKDQTGFTGWTRALNAINKVVAGVGGLEWPTFFLIKFAYPAVPFQNFDTNLLQQYMEAYLECTWTQFDTACEERIGMSLLTILETLIGKQPVKITPDWGAKEPALAAIPTENDICFKVSKRGYKVFSTLFLAHNAPEIPPGIQWNEFLSAMSSLGFSTFKLHGSGWVFEPVCAAFGPSIILHEPWVSSTIDFHMAKRIGRTLNRVYGLGRDSFVRAS